MQLAMMVARIMYSKGVEGSQGAEQRWMESLPPFYPQKACTEPGFHLQAGHLPPTTTLWRDHECLISRMCLDPCQHPKSQAYGRSRHSSGDHRAPKPSHTLPKPHSHVGSVTGASGTGTGAGRLPGGAANQSLQELGFI